MISLATLALASLCQQSPAQPVRIEIRGTIPVAVARASRAGGTGGPGPIQYITPPPGAYPDFDAIPTTPTSFVDADGNGVIDMIDDFEAALAAGSVTEVRVPAFPYAADYYSDDMAVKKSPRRIVFAHLANTIYMGGSDEETSAQHGAAYRPRLDIDSYLMCPAPGRQANISPEYWPTWGDWSPVVSWGYWGFPPAYPWNLTPYDGVWDYHGSSGETYRWVFNGSFSEPWHIWDLSGDSGGENLVCPDPCAVYGYGTIFPLDCKVAWGQFYVADGQDAYITMPEADGRVSMYLWVRYADNSVEQGGSEVYPTDHNVQARNTIYSIGAVGYQYTCTPGWPEDPSTQWRYVWVDFETGAVILDHETPSPSECYQ